MDENTKANEPVVSIEHAEPIIEKTDEIIDKELIKEIPQEAVQQVAHNDLENSLKVKADSPDISPEDRKRNVKKLAGAISHSLRDKGEINVRCFGSASISKAVKSISIAKRYVASGDKKLKLECSPGFITTKIGDNELTGINFVTFVTEIAEGDKDIDISKVKTVLKVKADPKDISSEDRKNNVKKLAGAIAHGIDEENVVIIRSFGANAISRAVKALAISRAHVASKGADLYCYPDFIVTDMGGNERTGIMFVAYTNKIQ